MEEKTVKLQFYVYYLNIYKMYCFNEIAIMLL